MKFPAIVNSGFSNVLTVLVFLQFCCQFSSIYTAHRTQFKTFMVFLQILVMGKPLTKYSGHTKLKDEPLHENEKETSTTEHEKSQVCFQKFWIKSSLAKRLGIFMIFLQLNCNFTANTGRGTSKKSARTSEEYDGKLWDATESPELFGLKSN